jgi:pimeloyl-ACP methyl ester carboxylesterase
MTMSVQRIQGLDVLIEGAGAHTVVLIHGWPDTHRLWDGTVQVLQESFRCVRFTLPGFDVSQAARATALAQMTALIEDIVDAVSPGQPVTLVLHDWGCVFGYEYAARRPGRVARIVGVDVGDYNSQAYRRSLAPIAKGLVFAYQLWLALAWTVGGATGDRMTRWMARRVGCRTPSARIGWKMNYPYAMVWFGLLGGLGAAAEVAHGCPMLFVYGTRKPFLFHSEAWQQALAARPGSAVQAFPTGHWVMLQQAQVFHECLASWLAEAAGAHTGHADRRPISP